MGTKTRRVTMLYWVAVTMATCVLAGDNPCCPWREDGACTFEDSISEGDNDPEKKTGAYSAECGAYLKACQEDWMTTSVEAMHSYIQENPDLIPNGMSHEEVDTKANDIVQGPWTTGQFNTDDGKCMSVGFATGTYLGVYNCKSAFEQSLSSESGCTVFNDIYGADKYVGTVREYPEDNTCPTPISRLDKSEPCAFNLFPDSTTEGFVYFANTTSPMIVTSRPWFKAASDAPDQEAPVWLNPYQDYTTNYPVFGLAQGVFVESEMIAAVLVLQYIADSPAYQQLDTSCHEASR